MFEYTRPVYYYETDQMGIVHHSNYVRWLEEARTEFFKKANLAYVETERLGLFSPIIEISLKYKFPARYGEDFTVRMEIVKYTGVRFNVIYTIVNEDGVILLEGESSHCFTDKNHRPASLKRVIPERHEAMKALVRERE